LDQEKERACLCVWREEDKDEFYLIPLFSELAKRKWRHSCSQSQGPQPSWIRVGWVSELEETLIEVAFTVVKAVGPKNWQNELASITRLPIPHFRPFHKQGAILWREL
jgi:hypothetical protein